jgi:hypothetical protein
MIITILDRRGSMADILINDETLVKGKLSITRRADYSVIPTRVEVIGRLATHKYFEEIDQIDTERYSIKDITVSQESFGSEDFNIIYDFTSEDFSINGGESILSKEEIEKTESKLYN